MPPVGFEPHSLSWQAAARLRLRLRSNWDRLSEQLQIFILLQNRVSVSYYFDSYAGLLYQTWLLSVLQLCQVVRSQYLKI